MEILSLLQQSFFMGWRTHLALLHEAARLGHDAGVVAGVRRARAEAGGLNDLHL
jgi:hypothetical protein